MSNIDCNFWFGTEHLRMETFIKSILIFCSDNFLCIADADDLLQLLFTPFAFN